MSTRMGNFLSLQMNLMKKTVLIIPKFNIKSRTPKDGFGEYLSNFECICFLFWHCSYLVVDGFLYFFILFFSSKFYFSQFQIIIVDGVGIFFLAERDLLAENKCERTWHGCCACWATGKSKCSWLLGPSIIYLFIFWKE